MRANILVSFGLFILLLVVPTTVFSQLVINPGTTQCDASRNGLRVEIQTNGNIQVFYKAHREFYGYMNTFFRVNNVTQQSTACSYTPVMGSGTVADPYKVILTHQISDVTITQTVTYVYPNKYYLLDFEVIAGATAKSDISILIRQDTGPGSDDYGHSYANATINPSVIASYGTSTQSCHAVRTSCSSNNPRYPASTVWKTASEGFTTFAAGHYNSNCAAPGSAQATFSNHLSASTTCEDVGLAGHWNLGNFVPRQSKTRRMLVGFGDGVSDFNGITVNHPAALADGSIPVAVSFQQTTFEVDEVDADYVTGDIKVTISDGILNADQSMKISAANISATSGTDYELLSNAFTIPAGNYTTPKVITLNNVRIKGNKIIQKDRNFRLTLSQECGALATLGTNTQTTVTIKDDDCNKYGISVSPNPVDAGATATVTVSLNAGVTVASGVTMNVVLSRDASSTATAGTHYTATLPTTLAFNSSNTSRTFSIPTLSAAPASSTLKLVATPTAISGSSCTPTAKDVTLQIVKRVITLEVVGNKTTIEEGGGTATGTTKIRAYIDSPAPSNINIPIAFTGTAVRGAGNDYTTDPTGATLTILSGQQEAFLTITALADDIIELGGDETVIVTASPVGIYAINPSGNPATINIVDKTDGTIVVEKFTPTTGDAKENPLTHGSFKIKYAANANTKCTRPVKVTYILSGTAVHSDDYTVPHLTEAIIGANTNFKEIPVTVKNNYIVQGDRGVIVTITGVTPQ